MRDTNGAVAWYKAHEVWPGQLPFDPDGMCLMICRYARDIAARYPSAVSAQEATPAKYRVTKVADIRRGMVVYYDDPRDDNPYGHIVTVVGRVKGADQNSLSSLLVRTNSVQANRIVVVRGDYFQRHWGDEFQFAATWLNGVELPDFHQEQADPEPEPPLGKNAPNLRAAIDELQSAVEHHRKQGHTRLVKALRRDIQSIRNTLKNYS